MSELTAGLPADFVWGVDKCRFSVSWPRVQPGGRGPANPKGVDFVADTDRLDYLSSHIAAVAKAVREP